MTTLGEQLEAARRDLAAEPAGALEAELLLAHCLGQPRSYLYAHKEQALAVAQVECFRSLLERRQRGEPLAYLTGTREFWSLDLRVSPAVLIPRPETERLVELALERIPTDAAWRLADLGTGSGAIALALAHERPHCEVHATEASAAALEVAIGNARRLGLQRVVFHHGSWCNPLQGVFQLIVSNPPYVAGDDPHLERGDCRFEPLQALTPGADDLSAFRDIAAQARDKLADGGWLLLEHGPDQGPAVRTLLESLGYQEVFTDLDLLGHERVTRGRAIAHAGKA